MFFKFMLVGKNAATKSVEQQLIYTGDEAGKLIAFRNLIREGIAPPVLVFVQSKERESICLLI